MIVSEHALRQYILKVNKIENPSEKTVVKLRNTLERLVGLAKPVKLNPREEIIRLLNNNCREAKYLYYYGVVFVVVDDVMVTCYSKRKNELILEV